ncbi:MAG: DUF1385 domain-containing protein [Chloroflexi bacterium]|nr:DUF1385 domain-containing protein [Chloroflexota bacterium]
MPSEQPTAHPASNSFGGQAVVEGVMIRGPRSIAVAVRTPDGEIMIRTRGLGGRLTNLVRRIPLVRGMLVLWETLAIGIWALAWASAVHNEEVDEHGEAKPFGVAGWLVLLVVLGFAVTVFFAGPVLVTAWLSGLLPDLLVIAIEGLVRLGLLLGYIRLIGRSPEVRRVFQYHAAEHKAVQALEQGRELSVQAVRRLPKEHPRCGTSFLLTVAVVAAIAFMFAGTEPLWWRFASRIVLIPVIAAVSYEAIRFGGLHLGNAIVRTLFSANLALQKLTTSDPDDEQIQVAIASLNAALEVEREAAEAASS